MITTITADSTRNRLKAPFDPCAARAANTDINDALPTTMVPRTRPNAARTSAPFTS